MVNKPPLVIAASDLRSIALLIARSLKEPSNYSNEFATDSQGNCVSVFDPKACVLDSIGHTYRATIKHFEIKTPLKWICYLGPPAKKVQLPAPDRQGNETISLVSNQLDAQIRFVEHERRGEKDLYMGMVGIGGNHNGSRDLRLLMLRVAKRLKGGDDMRVRPQDVGVLKECIDPKNGVRAKRKLFEPV